VININRSKPYTRIGLGRLLCCHCEERRATEQWSVQVCANNGKKIWVGVCTPCDEEFNAETLRWIKHPHAEQLINRYREILRRNE
jgi:hypothetical protein